MADENKEKETPENLGLYGPEPKSAKLKPSIVIGVVVGAIVVIVGSITVTLAGRFGGDKTVTKAEEEEIYTIAKPSIKTNRANSTATDVDADVDSEPDSENTELAKEDKKEPTDFYQQRPKQEQKIKTIQATQSVPVVIKKVIASKHNSGSMHEMLEQMELRRVKEADDARKSSLGFAVPGLGASKAAATNTARAATTDAAYPEIPTFDNMMGTDSYTSQNRQKEKSEFLAEQKSLNQDIYSTKGIDDGFSPYVVKAGMSIPCVLETSINSDLPGMVVARVRQNIFDTLSGRYLLIPQGATLVGKYSSDVSYGQSRVQVIFHRLDFPRSKSNPYGYSIQLGALQGHDLAGHTGLHDKVNNHYGKLAFGAVLSSIFSATAVDNYGGANSASLTYQQQAARNVAANINKIGQKIAEKQLNQQPVITIRGGTPFNVIVEKDLILRNYEGLR